MNSDSDSSYNSEESYCAEEEEYEYDSSSSCFEEEECENCLGEQYQEVVRRVNSGENKTKTKLAWYKLSGRGGASVDVDDAVALLEERVKDKDAEAMWMLGLCHEYGMGCEQDVERTEELYQQSCDNGSVVGKFLADNGKDGRGSGVMNVAECLLHNFYANNVMQ